MEGWIKLHRKVMDSWIWNNPRELKWWLTILLKVNHEPTKVSVSDGLYDIHAGESFISIEHWAVLFGCAKKTVLKFFNDLEKESMIKRKILGKGNRRKHLLIVENWGNYQNWKPEFTPKRNPNVPPNKNDKNEKKEGTFPSPDEITQYAKENGYDLDGTYIYNYYADLDFKDSNGNPVRNWKNKLRRVWFKPEHKLNGSPERIKINEWKPPSDE